MTDTLLASDRPSATAGHRVGLDSEVDSRGAEPSQNMDALAYGQMVRIAGAHRKAEVRALPMREGMALVADLLENPPIEVRSLKVAPLLGSIRAVGPNKVKRVLNKAGVVPGAANRYVGPSDRNPTITPGERVRIASVLRSWR